MSLLPGPTSYPRRSASASSWKEQHTAASVDRSKRRAPRTLRRAGSCQMHRMLPIRPRRTRGISVILYASIRSAGCFSLPGLSRRFRDRAWLLCQTGWVGRRHPDKGMQRSRPVRSAIHSVSKRILRRRRYILYVRLQCGLVQNVVLPARQDMGQTRDEALGCAAPGYRGEIPGEGFK